MAEVGAMEPITDYEGVQHVEFEDDVIEVPVREIEFEDDVIEGTAPAQRYTAPETGSAYRDVLVPDAWLGDVAAPEPATPGEPTLDEARRRGVALEPQPLSTMDGARLWSMGVDERRAWYESKLAPYLGQLEASARAHGLPVPLLATILLNELADISVADVAQEALPVLKGSLGIAQIQLDTAISRDLFPEISDAEIAQARESLVGAAADLTEDALVSLTIARRLAVAKRLRTPQHAIEGAAKHVRQLLDDLAMNHQRPWPHAFGLMPGSGGVYDRVDGASALARETAAAKMVAAAYNSPGIIVADAPTTKAYPNGRIHGENAASIAADLSALGLFRQPAP